MTRRGVLMCIFSVVLIAYLAVALSYTSRASASDTFKGLEINVIDSSVNGFVSQEDIDNELDTLSSYITTLRRDTLNTQKIERLLLSMDKIEYANCVVLNNGVLRIDARPLTPVARVFDSADSTYGYYINRAGKRMSAGPHFRVDVPVVVGNFSSAHPATSILPVIDHINADKDLSAFVSAIEVKDPNNIHIIPAITGQVINFGDTNDIDNKFRRLRVFYRDVISVKGWEIYDTISVKWRGQVVAKRRTARPATPAILVEEFPDIDSISTIAVKQSQISNSSY